MLSGVSEVKIPKIPPCLELEEEFEVGGRLRLLDFRKIY